MDVKSWGCNTTININHSKFTLIIPTTETGEKLLKLIMSFLGYRIIFGSVGRSTLIVFRMDSLK